MALHSLRLRRSLSVLSAFHRFATVSDQTSHSIFCPSAPSLSKSPATISPHWPLRLSSMASYSRLSLVSNSEDDEIGTDIASGSEDVKVGTDIASGSEDVKIGTDIASASEDVKIGTDIASASEDVKIGTDIASGSEDVNKWTYTPEGCDYNHWLIIMDFQDSKPTPEEMVRIYEETCAKGLNISVEEAKQKIYACTTTTYQGFQAVMTKEESEKFRGLPGVLFILPDSYADPVNKEYGGDKYINGTIIPRLPPSQYGGRQVRKDRSRNLDQPRYERPPRSAPNGQANPSFNQQGSMQGDGRHSRGSQNYSSQGPPQNYSPLGLGERIYHSPMNTSAPEGRDSYQRGRGPMPSHQDNCNGKRQGIYNHDMQGDHQPQGQLRYYVPPQGQGNFGSGSTLGLGETRDHSPMNTYVFEGRDSFQGGRGPMPSHQENFNQRGPGSYYHDVQENYRPQGEQRDYGPPLGQVNFGSGFTPGLGERRDHSPMNTYALEGRGPMSSHRGNYIQRVQESYNHDMQGNYQSQREQIDYVPPSGSGNFGGSFAPRLGERRDYSPMNTCASEGRDSYQGGSGPMPYHQVNYNQRGLGNYTHDMQGNYVPQGEQRDYVPPLGQSNYGSGFTPGLGERRGYSPMNTYAPEGKDSYQGRRGPMAYHQVNYNQRGHGSFNHDSFNHDMHGHYLPQGVQRDYVLPPSQSNYGSGFTPGLGERRDYSPMNNCAREGRDSYQGGSGPMPYHQVNYNQRGSGNYTHDVQGNYLPQGKQRDYVPSPDQSNYGSGFTPGLGERRGYSPMNTYAPEGNSYQGGRGPMPYHQVNYNQRGRGNYTHDVQENYLPEREQRDYVPRLGQGIFCSGFNLAQGGPYEQGGYRGHGAGMPYGQGQSHGSYPSSIKGQRFSQGFQRNVEEEQWNYTSGGQTWNNQWRF